MPHGLTSPAPWIFRGAVLPPGLIRVTSPPPLGSLSLTALAARTPGQGATTHFEFETQASPRPWTTTPIGRCSPPPVYIPTVLPFGASSATELLALPVT